MRYVAYHGLFFVTVHTMCDQQRNITNLLLQSKVLKYEYMFLTDLRFLNSKICFAQQQKGFYNYEC